jgi:acyl-CoA reductase-like NAD-dependent aldehyde dehydrogenase
MSQVDSKLVAEVVDSVLARLRAEKKVAPMASVKGGDWGVFDDVNQAIAATGRAQKVWEQTPKEARKKIIAALRKTMHEHAEDFARRCLEETGMGRFEDKVAKKHNSADATPGLEDLETRSWAGDKGFVYEDYAPYGVVAAITPSTHPIAVLFNSIVIIIAPGNGAVFNVHPAAKKVSAYAMNIFNRVIQENGGPANLITMLREPTLESAQKLFTHPDIRLIAATGGPALVKAAFASGKKVIAAGPGNPPVLVDETANLDDAARLIIEGASFDNNILCIAEKECFVVNSVFDKFMAAMAKQGAVRLNKQQIQALAAKVFSKNQRGDVLVSRDYVGKNASVLARAAGMTIPDSVRMLYGEAEFTCQFVQEEQMMPYMPVVRVKDVDEGIALAVKAEHGYGHTAMIYSNNFQNIAKFTKALNTTIVVVNGPSLAGNGGMAGEGYFSHTIASPTGEGVCTPRNFARVRRLTVHKALQIV